MPATSNELAVIFPETFNPSLFTLALSVLPSAINIRSPELFFIPLSIAPPASIKPIRPSLPDFVNISGNDFVTDKLPFISEAPAISNVLPDISPLTSKFVTGDSVPIPTPVPVSANDLLLLLSTFILI